MIQKCWDKFLATRYSMKCLTHFFCFLIIVLALIMISQQISNQFVRWIPLFSILYEPFFIGFLVLSTFSTLHLMKLKYYDWIYVKTIRNVANGLMVYLGWADVQARLDWWFPFDVSFEKNIYVCLLSNICIHFSHVYELIIHRP